MMSRKQIIYKWAFLFTFFLSSPCAARYVVDIQPYAGVDVTWKQMGLKPGVGHNLFKKDTAQGGGYVGLEFGDWLGVEAGFESTLPRTNQKAIGLGDAGLGYVILPGDPIETHRYKNKLSGWYVNFIGFTPWMLPDCSLRFFAGIGFSHKRLVLIDDLVSENGGSFGNDPYDPDAARRTFTAHKTLLRLTGGIQKMFSDHWGVKGIVTWENTNKFSDLKSKELPTGKPTATLNNSIGLGLGVLYKF